MGGAFPRRTETEVARTRKKCYWLDARGGECRQFGTVGFGRVNDAIEVAMTTEGLAVGYGVSSAIAWGAGDLSGGVATRKNGVYVVILFSQLVSVGPLFLLALLMAGAGPHGSQWLFASGAGICGAVGLAALYKGLACGRVALVAPLSSVITAVLPIVFNALTASLPEARQMVGFALALAAIWVLSASKTELETDPRELYLSLVAGCGFGLFFILMDQATRQGILWPLAISRMASMGLILLLLAGFNGGVRVPPRSQLPVIALAGLLDTAGNAFFALATHLGRLDISAVLASL